MKRNVGAWDRRLRGLFAMALIALVVFARLPAPWAVAALSLAGLMAFTSVIEFCPFYRALRLSTCRM
jgi:hypothetical protein